jgi:hypothetical protein
LTQRLARGEVIPIRHGPIDGRRHGLLQRPPIDADEDRIAAEIVAVAIGDHAPFANTLPIARESRHTSATSRKRPQ